MKKIVLFLSLTVLVLFSVTAVYAQTSDELKEIKKEIETLKQGQSTLQKDIQELKAQLSKSKGAAGPELKDIALNLEAAHVKGDKKAKVILIEFSDFQ